VASLDFTVVIPTFNRAPLLARAIDSVLCQTFSPHQVIVVDDGSTDNTNDVCSSYEGRIEFVAQKNSGASAARNHGIMLARCTWVAFLDSDDYWNPQHLERLAHAIAATDARASIYFDDMQMPEDDGTLWENIGFAPGRPWQLIDDASAWAFMKRQPMMLQTSVIRREALDRVGGLDVRFRLIHDSHLFCLLGIGGAVCSVEGVGCVQTCDDTSATRLTTAIPLNSAGKTEEDAVMWLEILRRHDALPKSFRRLARYNAAGTCWGVGMSLLKSGRYLVGAANLVRAAGIDPMLALWLLGNGTQRGYERLVRPKCAELVSEE